MLRLHNYIDAGYPTSGSRFWISCSAKIDAEYPVPTYLTDIGYPVFWQKTICSGSTLFPTYRCFIAFSFLMYFAGVLLFNKINNFIT